MFPLQKWQIYENKLVIHCKCGMFSFFTQWYFATVSRLDKYFPKYFLILRSQSPSPTLTIISIKRINFCHLDSTQSLPSHFEQLFSTKIFKVIFRAETFSYIDLNIIYLLIVPSEYAKTGCVKIHSTNYCVLSKYSYLHCIWFLPQSVHWTEWWIALFCRQFWS